MIYAGVLLLAIYALILLLLLIGNGRVKTFYSEKSYGVNRFSIIVPFRNEALNMPRLLKSITRLDYPVQSFELILVDDDSTDNSEGVITDQLQNSAINWRILPNKRQSNAPKKDAITTAVEFSNFEWIATTDADCEVPEQWLKVMDQLIQEKDPEMICGQVTVADSESIISEFQKFEIIALQGVAMGGFGWKMPLLCNGANMAYSKKAFKEVDGFHGNTQIASGDDLFLLEKFRRVFPNKVIFLKNWFSVVTTQPVFGLRNLIQQRIRWAAKTSKLKNPAITAIGLFTALINLWLVAGLVYFSFFSQEYFAQYGLVYFLKIIFDSYFTEDSSESLRGKVRLELFFFANLFYPFITTYITIRSLFGGYRWKGRNFKR
jgi:glycosyltransferase involved in cell wall biosynthesis